MPDFFVTLRDLEVSRVVKTTGSIRRVTLTGDQLGDLTRDGVACPPFATGAFDDHVKIFPPVGGALVLPTQREGYLDWPHDPGALTRDYTVRRFDAATWELDLEVVTGHAGPGARWAAEVAVGDRIHIAGPRGSTAHPTDAPAYVLIGDDAALPPIARFLETYHDHPRVTVVVVVDPDNADYPLPSARTTLIVRDRADTDPDELFDQVRQATSQHPDAYVWAALELRTARHLRGVLREAGVARPNRFVTHYWRRQSSPEADTDAGDKRAAHDQLEPMIDLLTPTVLRVAVTVGLPDAIDGGATTAMTAAAATGCDHGAVTTLLTFLTRKGLTRRADDGTYRLTGLGEHLLDEGDNYLAGFLNLDRFPGHMATALPGLLQATRTGSSGYEHVHQRTFWDTLSSDDELGVAFDGRLADWAERWIPAVVAHDACRRAASIIDVGGGAGTLAAALAEAQPAASVALVELTGPARRARAVLADHGVADRVEVLEGSFFDPLPPGRDVYVLAQVLHDWPDADARRILRRCAEALPDDGRVLIVERLVDDAATAADDDHAVMGVLMLALFGAKERTGADWTALLTDVGLEVVTIQHTTDSLGVIEARPAAS